MSHSLYIAAAHVLRHLVGQGGQVLFRGSEDPVRDALGVAADACVRLAEAEYQRDQALARVAKVLEVLGQADAVLRAQPLPTDGGDWELYALAGKVRQALDQAQQG